MLNVYIMGPYSPHATDPEEARREVERNIENAQIIAAAVMFAGGHPVVPHVMSYGIAKLFDEPRWLREGMYRLTQCDVGLRLPNSERSSGTGKEAGLAQACGIEVFDALAISTSPTEALPERLIGMLRGEGL